MPVVCTSVTSRGFLLTIASLFLFTFSFSQQFSFQREISGYQKGYAQLSGWKNIDSDAEGNLLVHDSKYNLVYKLNSQGEVVQRLSYSKTWNDLSAYVCFDKDKNMYVSSPYLKKIFIYSEDGVFLNSITRGTTWFGDIDTDESGNIYVLSNEGVLVYNKNRVFQYVIGEWGSGSDQFYNAVSLAVSNGKLYVSDKNRVHVFSSTGTYLFHFDFAGDLNSRGEIAIHPDGSIYVANSSYHRIDIFSPTGTPMGQFGTYGLTDGTIDGVSGITIDNAGNIYQADFTSKIQMFSSDGTFIKKFGIEGSTNTEVFHFPSSFDFDKDGNIYVINGENPRIKKVDRNGNVTSLFGANLFMQQMLIGPWEPVVCVTNESNFIVIDYYETGRSNVRMVDAAGNLKVKIRNPHDAATGDFSHHTFVETDQDDKIYVHDYDWVYLYDKQGNYLREFRVTQTQQGISDPFEHSYLYTSGLAVDDAHNIFVVDPWGDQVIMYNDQGIYKKQFFVPFPIAVVTDLSRNLVYISTEHNGIFVYNYDAQFLAPLEIRKTWVGDYDLPLDLAIDPITRNLFVLDFRQQRILEYTFTNTQSITFPSLSTHYYGEEPITLAAKATSNLPITYTSSDEEVAVISGDKVVLKGIGQTTITATQSGNDLYFPATPQVQQLTVVKGNQFITFGSLDVVRYGIDPVTPFVESTSGLDVTLTSSDNAVAEIVDGKIFIRKPGTVEITASQDGNELYNPATPVTRSLTVLKGEQVISFEPISTKTYGDAPFALNVSASSGLLVGTSSSSETVIVLNGNSVTITGAGEVTITASQEGNEYYNPAEPVSESFTISKAKQTISFEEIPEKIIGDAEVELLAVATSTLPVTFIVDDETIATITTNHLSINGVGSTLITATQPGNENNEPAPPVSRILIVNNVLGIEDQHPNITVFPNPTTSFITIESPDPIQSVEVLDVTGHSMHSTWTGSQIDLTQLKAGVYYLRISLGSHAYYTKVVKH